MTKTLQKLRLYWPLILLTIFFSLFYLIFINLFNSDIGRHITNGREIFLSFSNSSEFLSNSNLKYFLDLPQINPFNNVYKILTTNYYSYTQTNFANINHHWFFGIISYLVHELGGFKLLTWFNLLLNSLAFIFILLTALKMIDKNNKLNIIIVTVVSFLIMPLITNRTEVRPESFSFLFLSIYYYLFNKINLDWKSSKTNRYSIFKKKWLWILLIVFQIFWVNTHLFFIFGPLLAGFFLFQELLVLIINLQEPHSRKLKFGMLKKQSFKKIINNKAIQFWFLLSTTLFLVSLINPYGLNGLLAPFNIFNNYGYRVAENQSTFFLIDYGLNKTLNIYIVVTSIFVSFLGFISLFRKRINHGEKFSQLLILIIFIILANKISRMTPFLGLFMIPYLSSLISNIIQNLNNIYLKKNKLKIDNNLFTMFFSTVIFISLILILRLKIFTPNITIFGYGELPNSYKGTEFITQNNLKGPVFNNYDIGGYIAYNLFPQERLFIDNRPEAYSENFIKNEFLASLRDESTWQEISVKYDFNIIFFYRHDQIDGAQEFLFNRVKSEKWIPVFVDNFVLIFVKNIKQNQNVIDQFEISQKYFGMN